MRDRTRNQQRKCQQQNPDQSVHPVTTLLASCSRANFLGLGQPAEVAPARAVIRYLARDVPLHRVLAGVQQRYAEAQQHGQHTGYGEQDQ